MYSFIMCQCEKLLQTQTIYFIFGTQILIRIIQVLYLFLTRTFVRPLANKAIGESAVDIVPLGRWISWLLNPNADFISFVVVRLV
jgi:hypothetical protein